VGRLTSRLPGPTVANQRRGFIWRNRPNPVGDATEEVYDGAVQADFGGLSYC
jgi:hypothetical protein